MNDLSPIDKEWTALCRAQREAYRAWQEEPANQSGALERYRAACAAQDDWLRVHNPKALDARKR